MDMLNPDNQSDIRIDTRSDNKSGQYIIRVMMRDMDQMVAKQAEQYLKSLIAKALQTAVMEKYSMIQSIVETVILDSSTRTMIENKITEEIAKRVKENVDDMFG